MKKIVFIVLMISMFSAYSQDTIPNKKPVLSIGIRTLYGVVPYVYSLGMSTNNLKNYFSFAYNSFHNNKTNSLWRPGIQIAYNRYFLNKYGPVVGLGYNYAQGVFEYAGLKRDEGYIGFKNLQYFNLNCGYYYRFKLNKFGILESSFNITYFFPTNNSNYINYFKYSTMPRFLPNLDIKYYFKRNKPKN